MYAMRFSVFASLWVASFPRQALPHPCSLLLTTLSQRLAFPAVCTEHLTFGSWLCAKNKMTNVTMNLSKEPFIILSPTLA